MSSGSPKSVSTLEAIAGALGVKVKDLFEEVDG